MDDLLEMRFGKGTVRENLALAVAKGSLLISDEGQYIAPAGLASDQYLQVNTVQSMSCQFLNKFLFHGAYNRSAVPHGCRTCFKVKLVPQNLRELIALRGVLEIAPYQSKCGVDLLNPYSRDFYAGFLYLNGLEAARNAYRDIQDRINNHPDLCGRVLMTIKRGCSHFEAACGSSDRWTFHDEMETLEEKLKTYFQVTPSESVEYRVRRMNSMIHWIQIAYNLKDDSYLDFTNGRVLHQSTLAYPPDDSTDIVK